MESALTEAVLVPAAALPLPADPPAELPENPLPLCPPAPFPPAAPVPFVLLDASVLPLAPEFLLSVVLSSELLSLPEVPLVPEVPPVSEEPLFPEEAVVPPELLPVAPEEFPVPAVVSVLEPDWVLLPVASAAVAAKTAEIVIVFPSLLTFWLKEEAPDTVTAVEDEKLYPDFAVSSIVAV